jgi:hypothetical protein
MEQRRIPLSAESLDQMTHYDMSIGHWSQEHTKASLQIRSMLDNIDSLFQARQALLDRIISEAGVDPGRVVQIQPMRSGETVELALVLKPEKPKPGPQIVMPDGTPAVAAPPPPPPGNPTGSPGSKGG